MNVSAERRWAVGLTQEQFEREWPKYYPGSDVIPDVNFWVTQGEPKYASLIDGVKPEDFLSDDVVIKKEEPVEEELEQPDLEKKKNKGPKKGHFPCRGCGQVFEYKIARSGHEKGCKVALNTKMEA